jgi:hypothetical protein
MARERPPLDPALRAAARGALINGTADIVAFLAPRRGLQGDIMAEFGRAYAAMRVWELELQHHGLRVEAKVLARAIDRVIEEDPPPPFSQLVDDPEDPEDVDLDK